MLLSGQAFGDQAQHLHLTSVLYALIWLWSRSL